MRVKCISSFKASLCSIQNDSGPILDEFQHHGQGTRISSLLAGRSGTAYCFKLQLGELLREEITHI